ncbi:hypothetical protein [Janthinobacterium lividum]|uniref:hypothetical protein n=1 Tax=Janthinobacterium lividum TaxID=29581 RepID=UPI000873E732|nr:hypothetical protein [Janthinobacterium lividum]MCC7714661.1 hypothetical protein [Janthinobacterium lividum]WQE30139.1 hypothetical protein U0004_06910 [Janthinobacterium lividum]
MQIIVGIAVNSVIAMMLGAMAGFQAQRPTWVAVQRWMMVGMLTGLVVKMAARGGFESLLAARMGD